MVPIRKFLDPADPVVGFGAIGLEVQYSWEGDAVICPAAAVFGEEILRYVSELGGEGMDGSEKGTA